MKRSITEYYKETVKRGAEASRAIGAAKAQYEDSIKMMKASLAADDVTQKRYDERCAELAAERDARIEGALSQVLKVVDEFDADMDEIGRLDGSKVDGGILKLLDSGITLTARDWQQLADAHRNNEVMTRILKARYDSNRPQEEKPVLVRFGQLAENRKEVFSKFVRTVYHACESGACPSLSGSGRFKTTADYYNYLAQASLAGMQPFEGEDFDSLNADFPVETEGGKVEDVSGKATNFDASSFGFNFAPVR